MAVGHVLCVLRGFLHLLAVLLNDCGHCGLLGFCRNLTGLELCGNVGRGLLNTNSVIETNSYMPGCTRKQQ